MFVRQVTYFSQTDCYGSKRTQTKNEEMMNEKIEKYRQKSIYTKKNDNIVQVVLYASVLFDLKGKLSGKLASLDSG